MQRKNGRNHGEVFTNKSAIHYILDEVGYSTSKDLRDIRILEPASGKGAFAIEIIKRLFNSSIAFNFSFSRALVENVRLIELDLLAFSELRIKVDNIVENLTGQTSCYSSTICIQTDFLEFESAEKFNCIVGNPPYIRHELLSEEKKQIYRSKYKTFKYRADLYVLFFEHSLNLLKRNGILSFICSNRWLNNQYGEGLRELISTKFNLKKLLNIEKSSPFDEDVIAYPCISTIENKQNSGLTLFCEDNSKEIDFVNIIFNEVKMPANSSWQNLFLEYDINHGALLGIIEQGFEIGIGVATGADSIFIKSKSEIDVIERDRLIPLIKSCDLKNNTFNWGGHYVINPYKNGNLCDLDNYPNLKSYLNENKEALLKRHTAQKSPNKWFKTIDKIKPELQFKPKLLLPDLTGNKILFIDEGNYYPHHNLYYITCNDISRLKILASILMADFTRQQMSQIGIRMNGGLPRFQSQVLKKIKIPNISFIDYIDKRELIKAYENQDLETLNQIVKKYCSQNKLQKRTTPVFHYSLPA
jgi:adenine-specific DNA-methyltransferase